MNSPAAPLAALVMAKGQEFELFYLGGVREHSDSEIDAAAKRGFVAAGVLGLCKGQFEGECEDPAFQPAMARALGRFALDIMHLSHHGKLPEREASQEELLWLDRLYRLPMPPEGHT